MATTTAIRIGPADHGRAMTLQEFLDAEEEEGYRYELARGVLEVTLVPNESHRQVVCNLYRSIAVHDVRHPGLILAYGGGAEFRLWLPGMISGRNPDLGVVLRGAPKDLWGRRNPALVAEVVSEGGEDRDYRIKREEYLAFGVMEYWIVEMATRSVTVLIRRGDVWDERVFRDTQVIASVVLPGFATTMDELWADVEPED